MEKEVSCINSRAILDYVKAKSSIDDSGLLGHLHPEIDTLRNPEAFLRDPNNWISCTVATELYRRARVLLDDDRAAFKIARFAIENMTMGYGQRILLKAFGSESAALRHAQKVNDKWNRNKRVELVKLKKTEGVVRLHWTDHMDVTKDLCLMNKGTYTFAPLIWGGKPTDLTETCCHFEGAPYCEYHIKWSASNRLWEKISRIFKRKSVLMETISEMEKDKEIIEQKYEEVNRLNQKLNLKFKQLMAVQDTGKAILSVLDLDELLSVIMNILSDVCKINRAIIMLVNREKERLEYIYGAGFEGEVPDKIKNYTVPLGRVENIISRVAGTGQPEYVPEVKLSGLRKGNIILSFAQPTSVFVVPLITRTRVIGVIAIDAVETTGVPRETRKTLEIFAPQIAIAIQNAKLYSKLQEQMKELKKSKALLKRAEKISYLGNVAARLAHEIKNPMTAIVTFMQMLPAKYDDEEFRKDFYAIAMEETGRINNLITELLDLAKTREMNVESINLHGLITRMIRLVSAKSQAKKIDVTTGFSPGIGKVLMDSEKMTQVLLNLLSNAVEFAPEGGRIEIITKNGTANNGSREIRIEIRDNGPGIDPAMVDRIFDPYFTTKHKSDIHRGTGLGLFIAHQNMRDHGGNIEVSSDSEKGTVFLLTLPDSAESSENEAYPLEMNHAD